MVTSLLTVAEMGEADRRTIAAGTPGTVLMEHAGAAVANAMRKRWLPSRVLVLCGPGNNGGDGFVVARLLAEAGWTVTLALLGQRGQLRGDAAHHAGLWTGPILPFTPEAIGNAELIVDALYGAGLSRPVAGEGAAMLEAVRNANLPMIAVDVPSGVHGDTGADWGAVKAVLTVTFARAKPGHLLLPGRSLCGELIVAPIGISDETVASLSPQTSRNSLEDWRGLLPALHPEGHKYTRGHAVIMGGWPTSGAARLAARAALRIGAGLASVAVPPDAFAVYAASLTAVMVRAVTGEADLALLLGDTRHNALLIGPGAGAGPETLRRTLLLLRADRAIVLDADAITSLASAPQPFREAMDARSSGKPVVLTPHEGEFRRLFPIGGDKLARAREAAKASGAVIVLKGADTVIAAPDGRATINDNAPPTLATAGSGDVLSGMILGLLAQGMDGFDAARAAVWLHGAAAALFGAGLIAEDLPECLAAVLSRLS